MKAFDWQLVAAALIVGVAAIYVARRGWSRARTFLAAKGSTASGAACSGCDSSSPKRAPAANRTVFVEIGRPRPTTRKRTKTGI